MGNYDNIVSNDYKTKKELPKYFVIKRDGDNPLWQKYIDWLNLRSNKVEHFDGTELYYGYDGSYEWNGYKYNRRLEQFNNNPTLITLEYWNECINGKEKVTKRYEFDKFFNRYFKQLKENIKLREENSNLQKDIDMLNNLNNAGTKELMFSNLQKEHYKSLLEEVEVLVSKGIKKELIQEVISNGYKKAELDLAIHCDEIFFNNKKED